MPMLETTDLGQRVASAPLVEIAGVRQVYHKGDNADLVVLDDVSLTIQEGEIVGLLGRSGSGKSTLLRIIAGLLQPTSGRVRWRGTPISGPCEGIAMVFQSFALFPWLTVLGNVELGLEALGIPASERRRRAIEAIDLIGLDGFESAYPKELSGGMRQRVGFARALVVHPRLMLMDEPFSALDVLTAETLRTDLIDLWSEGRLPIESILMVTHNIEEAVLLCDRILIFSSNPGRVASEVKVEIPHPRSRTDPVFRKLVDDIYGLMTQRPTTERVEKRTGGVVLGSGIGMALPRISTNRLSGLMEALASPPYDGSADLPDLAHCGSAAAPALCGGGRGRREAHALWPALCRVLSRCAQTALCRSPARIRPAGGADPARVGRAAEPQGAFQTLLGGARGSHVRGARRGDHARRHFLGPVCRIVRL
jgi:NitT/TauT family transport system ATP-binding protein